MGDVVSIRAGLALPRYALTVWQPYAGLLATGVKTVENRTWEPGRSLRVGDRVMIHAGARYDRDSWEHVFDLTKMLKREGRWRETSPSPWPLIGRKPNPDADPAGTTPYKAIIGVATLDEVRRMPRGDDPWWIGPVGWYLRDPVAIEPVFCDGAQGLWVPSTEVLGVVAARLVAQGGAR